MQNCSLQSSALAYLTAGLSVIPTRKDTKAPVIPEWKSYQAKRASEDQVRAWFNSSGRCAAIITGRVSGNLEMLDFDQGGELFDAWADKVGDEAPGLLERLVIERSQSSGRHVVYRCPDTIIPGNHKLALRAIETDGPEEVEIAGKRYKPRSVAGRWLVELTLIETRGEGGYFLAAPSPGYALIQGDFTALPGVSLEERETLLTAARVLNEWADPTKAKGLVVRGDNGKPGEDFNRRGDVQALLERHGWTFCGQKMERGGSRLQHFIRPGKVSGVSATLFDDSRFYCFTSNGAPFEAGESYMPFGVYAELEHGGDYSAAARALAAEGYGEPPKEAAPTRPLLDLEAWRANRAFAGAARPREYLVEGVFPMGQASLIAASGGVGKSFACLALCVDVAASGTGLPCPPRHFGGALARTGQAVYISAEDDQIEIHNRLDAIGRKPERLITVPLPSAGGAASLFSLDPHGRTPKATDAWTDIRRQIAGLERLAVVVLDPLQPLCALDLNQPENAQFVCSQLSALAAESGAAVIVTHHFAKKEANTPDEARQAIRGTAGLVDGVRAVYALWLPPSGDDKEGRRSDEAKRVCKALDVTHEPGKVVKGAVVKANGRANQGVSTFVRQENGLLLDRTEEVRRSRPGQHGEDLEPLLAEAVAEAARQGKPYTKTGGNGLFDRRHELPEPFHYLSKHGLPKLAEELLAKGLLVQAMASGSRAVKWLDAPNGPFAQGEGAFTPGHMEGGVPGFPVPSGNAHGGNAAEPASTANSRVPGSRVPAQDREGCEASNDATFPRSRSFPSYGGREGPGTDPSLSEVSTAETGTDSAMWSGEAEGWV